MDRLLYPYILADPKILLSEQPWVTELMASELLQFLDTLEKISMGQLFFIRWKLFQRIYSFCHKNTPC